jgi:hypothetical protein
VNLEQPIRTVEKSDLNTCQYFLLTSTKDGGKTWYDEVQSMNFLPRVRQLLGGNPERRSDYESLITAFFGKDDARRVLVIGFPPSKGWTLETAQATLKNINENDEELS